MIVERYGKRREEPPLTPSSMKFGEGIIRLRLTGLPPLTDPKVQDGAPKGLHLTIVYPKFRLDFAGVSVV
jgi:hypothetical protein